MLLERDKPVNFVEVILDLRREPHRMKLSEIARSINVDVNTLKGWFYGGHSPSFEDGRALITFHEQLTKSCHSNQPGLGTGVQESRARDFQKVPQT